MNKFLITTLTLLFFGLSLHAQSSKSTVVVEKNDHKYELKTLNGEIIKFEVDGKKVAKEDYEFYSEILQSLQEDWPKHQAPIQPQKIAHEVVNDGEVKSAQCPEELEYKSKPEIPTDSNDELALALKEMLIESGDLTNTEKYRIKMKKNGLTLNGKRLPDELFETAKMIYEDIIDRDFDEKTKVYIKHKRNSTSTSIIRSGAVTLDYEIK